MAAVLSIIISVAALVFSFFVFTESRRKDMRDAFLSMHQLMVSADTSNGRYLLFEKVTDRDSVERLTDEDYRDINRALSTYNTLGLYVEKKYLSERDVLDLWAVPVYRAWRVAQPFISHRTEFQGHDPWIYLKRLAEKAERNLTARGIDTEVKVWSRSVESAESAGQPGNAINPAGSA